MPLPSVADPAVDAPDTPLEGAPASSTQRPVPEHHHHHDHRHHDDERRRAIADDAPVFVPLRVDPPPRLYATWWIRYTLFLAQMVGLAVVLLTEYATGPTSVATAPVVVVPYALVGVLLVAWSGLAMFDAARLVPATRYHPPSRPWVAMTLWLVAFAAPVVAVVTVERARERFTEDADDIGVVIVTVAVVMICFLLVWLPFQYHTRQAHRIGAPARVVAAWFWLPLLAAVGALAINALGLHDFLAGAGFTDWDRTVQVAVIFGLPALTFALSTWRATTVFDEVIEIRWLRWRKEWEQTLDAMAAQPAPGPEHIPPPPPRR